MDITICLPPDLTEKVEREAARRGMTLPDLVLSTLERIVAIDLDTDSLFTDPAVFTGDAPSNLSENHDDFLYGDAS